MPSLSEIKRKDFEKFLVIKGLVRKRQKGSHIVYTKQGLRRPIVIVAEKKLKPGVVRSCLKTLGIAPEEFIREITKRK